MAVMATEIEAKYRVENHAALKERLRAVKAVFRGQAEQQDWFFDRPGRELLRGDKGLRLRQETSDKGTRRILCFKGPRQKGSFKRRQETEVEISSGRDLREMLEALGFEVILSLEKTRRLWQMGECLVCLDKVGKLGNFVEIEGPDESAIQKTALELGLENAEHITESYAAMLAKL